MIETTRDRRPLIPVTKKTIVSGLILLVLVAQLILLSLGNAKQLPSSLVVLLVLDPLQRASERQLELQERLAQTQTQLEFMVWERERVKLIQGLETYLQQRLNHEPVNYQLWYSLLAASQVANYSDETRAWILERALFLNRWNPSEVAGLAADCFTRYDTMITLLPQDCDAVVIHLSQYYKPGFLSRFVGMPASEIEQVLRQHRRSDD